MNDMLNMGRQVLASQPLSVLLAAELAQLAEGRVELKIPIHAEPTPALGSSCRRVGGANVFPVLLSRSRHVLRAVSREHEHFREFMAA